MPHGHKFVKALGIFVLLSAAVIVISLGIALVTKNYDEDTETSKLQSSKPQDAKCLGGKLEFPDFVNAAAQECGEAVKDKESICYEACQFKKYGVILDELTPKFDLVRFDEVISKFPQVARDGVAVDARRCFSHAGPLSDGDNCKSHTQYVICILEAYARHCHIGDVVEE